MKSFFVSSTFKDMQAERDLGDGAQFQEMSAYVAKCRQAARES